MQRFDIAVIGTGPAGLSAAITATIRNKTVLLLGSKDLSEKLSKAHEIQNYLGFPAIPGEKLAEAFQKHLDQMGIEITEKRINAVYAMAGARNRSSRHISRAARLSFRRLSLSAAAEPRRGDTRERGKCTPKKGRFLPHPHF